MSKQNKISNQEQINEYISKLESPLGEVIEALRKIILSISPEIDEVIKWNSPCFVYIGEMKPFDPKEYKRDIAVVNIRKGYVLLVFVTGTVINDTTGLLEGDYKDGRRLAKFIDVEDVNSKENALRIVISEWLKLVDKPS